MTAYLWNDNLTYVSVPKCACSSMKHFFFETINGFRFQNFRDKDDKLITVHRFFQSVPFEKLPHAKIAKHFKMALVRKPIDRIFSCYQDKVLNHGALKKAAERNPETMAGLNPEPTFEEFVRHLARYRMVSTLIRDHTETLSHFLGNDPHYFDLVADISESDRISDHVIRVTGTAATLPHRNRTGSSGKLNGVSAEAISLANEMFAEDERVFGMFFQVEA
ncbi:MAG: sulfotransferase family 2 domain-containing protein [Pseudomonadota bacterium]